MSERRFIITEMGQRTRPEQPITESELRRRLKKIIDSNTFPTGIFYPEAISILLHGSQREEACPYCKTVHKDTDTCMGYPEPDPWDEWVEKMPYFMLNDAWSRDNWKDWLRQCPCSRKE